MTFQRLTPKAKALGQMLRGLSYFQVLHETYGITEVTDPGGCTWNYFDLRALQENLGVMTTPRQHQALVLGYFFDQSEAECAAIMGTPGNPVFMYANAALNKIAERWAA